MMRELICVLLLLGLSFGCARVWHDVRYEMTHTGNGFLMVCPKCRGTAMDLWPDRSRCRGCGFTEERLHR